MRVVFFAAAALLVVGSFAADDIDGLPGLTPTAAQTGMLKENQKMLYGPTETKCARHANCKTCVEDIGCGWCATMGNCFDGNVLGATSANCSMWEFAWCSGENCVEHASCGACVEDPMCGWCAGTQSCTEGSAKGPLMPDCLADEWLGEACTAEEIISKRLSAAQGSRRAMASKKNN